VICPESKEKMQIAENCKKIRKVFSLDVYPKLSPYPIVVAFVRI
jgi:hypothetical protein